MKYGLSSITIEKLKLLFFKYNSIEKVILYGSRAKGNYREGSDIDLTIKGDNIDSSDLINIKSEIDDLLLAYKVDLSIYTHLTNNDLKNHILRVGKLFYEKKSDSKTPQNDDF